jgi:hypothetical protein
MTKLSFSPRQGVLNTLDLTGNNITQEGQYFIQCLAALPSISRLGLGGSVALALMRACVGYRRPLALSAAMPSLAVYPTRRSPGPAVRHPSMLR